MRNVYKINEVNKHRFYQVPKELFISEFYQDLSSNAKLLYGMLLDRMKLSEKNNWVNDEGEIYLHFSRDHAQQLLNISNKTAVKVFKELENKELIFEERQFNGPNIIYIGKIDYDKKQAEIPEMSPKCRNYTSESVESTSPKVKNLHPNDTELNNTNLNNTNYKAAGENEKEKNENAKLRSDNKRESYKKDSPPNTKNKQASNSKKEDKEKNNAAASQPDIYNFISNKTDRLFTEVFDKDITLKQAKQLSKYDQKYIISALNEMQKRNTGTINAPVRYLKPIIEDFKVGKKKPKQNGNDQLREIYQEYDEEEENEDNSGMAFFNSTSKYDQDWNNDNNSLDHKEEKDTSNNREFYPDNLKDFELIDNAFLDEEDQQMFYKMTGRNITKEQLQILKNNYDYFDAYKELKNKYYFFNKGRLDNLTFSKIWSKVKEDNEKEKDLQEVS